MSVNENQCDQNIRPTQAPYFSGNHFILGDQVTVTAFRPQPLTGNKNNTSVNQFQGQLIHKPKIKGNQSNTAKKPAKPRQRAEQSQPKKRQTKTQQNKQQRAPNKSDLKVNWKKKNNSTTSKMLNGSRNNGNQGRPTVDQISGFEDNKGVLPRQGITNIVHRTSVNGREPSRVTEAGQQEDLRLPDRLQQDRSASRQSPNFFNIRNIVNNGTNQETSMTLTSSETKRIVTEVIDVDDETQENNNINLKLKPCTALYGKTNIMTSYVYRDNQSRENTGWEQNISQHKDVTIVKRPELSQAFESHNQPSTSVATASNRPTVSSSSIQARGQLDQREQDKDSVSDVIDSVAGFNGNNKIIAESSTNENKASPTKMDVSRPQSSATPRSSLEKVKAKAKYSKQSPKTLKPKNKQLFVATQNTPPSTIQLNPSQDVLAGVVAQLSCHMCKLWVGSEQLKMCDCGIVCPTCFVQNQACAVCKTEPRGDAGAAQLHCRLAAVVPHQCRYRGCPYTVQPGEDHEPHCPYQPFNCYQCEQPVPRNGAVEHFQTYHPQQPTLGDKNENVKINNFYQNPATKKLVAYCFVLDQHLTIMINKIENQPTTASFLIYAPLNDDNTKITVKFDFMLKLYTHSKEVTFNSSGPAYVDVQMEVFNDWTGGLCTLDLNIAVKKIRKYNKVDNGSQKKKPKLSK